MSVDAEEVIKRRLTVADLDVRKIILKAKQDAIGEVLKEAYEKLCALKKTEYLKLVEKTVGQAADIGDEIVLSSDGVINKEDVKKLGVFSAKKLSVSEKAGDFKGGVYLIGKTCDKDLTFKALIENGKDEFISEISEELFGK